MKIILILCAIQFSGLLLADCVFATEPITQIEEVITPIGSFGSLDGYVSHVSGDAIRYVGVKSFDPEDGVAEIAVQSDFQYDFAGKPGENFHFEKWEAEGEKSVRLWFKNSTATGDYSGYVIVNMDGYSKNFNELELRRALIMSSSFLFCSSNKHVVQCAELKASK